MKPYVHRGVLSIEVAITLVIVMLASILGLTRYKQHMTEMEWTVEARRMEAVSAAAKSYIRDNRDTLINQVSGGTPATITGANLQASGYLPDGFTMTNIAAQTFVILVVRNPKATSKLVAFVLTQGGNAIEYRGLRYIAQAMNGAGGYIHTSNIAEGAYGSWKINLATYGLSGQTGHLVAFLSSEVLGTDDRESDRLYRYSITSRPELNRMHTAIDMNNNSLNNASSVNAQQGTFSGNISAKNGTFGETVTGKNGVFNETVAGKNGTFSETVSGKNANLSQGLIAGSDIRTKDGWMITQNAKGWMNSTHAGGFYMSDSNWIRSLNNKGIYTGGEVRAGSITSEGRLKTGEYLQLDKISTEGATCSPNGLISRASGGGLLSCISGKWTGAGGGLSEVTTIRATVGANIQPVSTHICYPSSYMKWGNTRSGNWHLEVISGYWKVTRLGGEYMYVTCFRYK